MKIIKTYELKEGDVIDFTTKEPIYWNKKTLDNKVNKRICPFCKRIGRTTDYMTFDHSIGIGQENKHGHDIEVIDSCTIGLDITNELRQIRRMKEHNIPLLKEHFEEITWTIAQKQNLI